MLKKIFAEHGVKNAVTLFHKPSSPGSSRILTMLKQVSANANATSTEDQASPPASDPDLQHKKIDLDVVEGPPTGDQLRSILEFVGENNASNVVQGASGVEDALRRLRANASSFQRPLVVDWNQGKVVVGEKESEILKLLKNVENN